MFIAAQFTITKCWKQPRCPSVNEWIKKLWYIYTMEFYEAERRKELLPFATAWMELESIMLSETSQAVRDKYHMISLLTGTQSTKQMSKQNITKDIEIENRVTVTRRERGGNFRGKGWRVCRNNYKGHMDNNGGTGNGREVGRVGKGETENCTWTTIKNLFLKRWLLWRRSNLVAT